MSDLINLVASVGTGCRGWCVVAAAVGMVVITSVVPVELVVEALAGDGSSAMS